MDFKIQLNIMLLLHFYNKFYNTSKEILSVWQHPICNI